MIDETISHYRILEKLGEGGMGTVYKAEDTNLRRTVALKIANEKDRFLREAQAAASLNHANICTIFEIDEANGFIAMELVDGKSLKDKIAARPLPLEEAIDLAIQICHGLQHAHERGVVHRDIKPANIMLTAKGQVKIMDFGLAQIGDRTRITQTGAAVGTPAYMSPEQTRGESTDRRTDLWSLGATLYEMIAGLPPFKGDTPGAVTYNIVNTQPEPLTSLRTGVPLELDRITAKALRKNPADRYANAEDLAVDLRHALAQTPAGKPLVPKWLWPAAAIALLAAAASIFLRDRTPPIPSPSSYQQITSFSDSVVQPALSPDGRMVAFVRGASPFTDSGQIYVKLLPGGEPVQLTRDDTYKMSPVFSPDGARIVYTVRTNFTGWDSWVVPVLGGEPKPFLPNASGLVWTAPGKVLFSEITRGIHMKIVAATESRSESRDIYVPPHQRGMAHRSWLSPDGKWVLLAEMDNAGWLPCRLVPADGSSLGRPVGPNGRCLFAAWSPDGRTMYFSAEARNGSQIWSQSFPGGDPVQITQGPSEAAGIAMAPDGKSLITAIGIEQSSIWLSVNGQERQVTQQGFASPPAFGAGVPRSVFSPDGKKLFYLLKGGVGRGFGSGGELWSIDLASGATEHVLPGISVTSYDVSQTGKHVVYSAIDAEFKSRIWIAPLDRGEPPRRLTDRDATGPTFATAGFIYYKADDGGQNYLFKQSLDGGTSETKVRPEPAITAPNASPDGKWVSAVFQLSSDGRLAAIMAVSTGGGDPVPICKGCLTRWFPDGKAMLIENMGVDTESRGVIVPLAAGQMLPKLPSGGLADLEAFAALPGSKQILKLFPIPGPNSSTFLFVKRTVQRNLYRIPLE